MKRYSPWMDIGDGYFLHRTFAGRTLYVLASESTLGTASGEWYSPPVAMLTFLQPGGVLTLDMIQVWPAKQRKGIAERTMLGIRLAWPKHRALWVTVEGQAFAREFIRRHGPMPGWEFTPEPFSDADGSKPIAPDELEAAALQAADAVTRRTR